MDKGLKIALFENLLGLRNLPDDWEKVEEIENPMVADGVLDIQELDGGDVFLRHSGQECKLHFKGVAYLEVESPYSKNLSAAASTAHMFYSKFIYNCVQHEVKKLPILVNKKISYLEENGVGNRFIANRYEAACDMHLHVQVAKLVETPSWAMWMPIGITIEEKKGVTTPKMKKWLDTSGMIGTSSHFISYWDFKIPVGKEMKKHLPLPFDFPNHPPKLGYPTPNETINKDWEQWLLSIGRPPYRCPCSHCWTNSHEGTNYPCILWS